MNNIINAFKGKKSYITALALIVYSLLGVYLGKIDMQTAVYGILGGIGLGSLRNAIS